LALSTIFDLNLHHNRAREMSQGVLKVRKRDVFLDFLRGQPSTPQTSQNFPEVQTRDRFRVLGLFRKKPPSRSVSPSPPATLGRREPSLADHTQPRGSPLSSQQKAFKRSSSLANDLAVLSTTYLFQDDNAELRNLIVLIVRLHDRDKKHRPEVRVHIWVADSGLRTYVFHS
jgi:hypothetical protein